MKIDKINREKKGRQTIKKISQTQQTNKELFDIQWKLTQTFRIGYRNMTESSL